LSRAPLTVIADSVSFNHEKLSSRNYERGEKNHKNTHNFVINKMDFGDIKQTCNIQGVSGGILYILGDGIMQYSE